MQDWHLSDARISINKVILIYLFLILKSLVWVRIIFGKINIRIFLWVDIVYKLYKKKVLDSSQME